MLDISMEAPVRLEDIASHCQTHFSTVYRWALKGLPGPDGKRIRLEALRCGGRWVSSWPALQRFCLATTPHLDGESAPVPRSATQKQRSSERAAAQLAKIGI